MPGDILVNRVNSRELVGKAAVIPGALETCVFESKNIRLRLRHDLVYPELVNYALSLGGRHHFTQNAQQVVGMASISQPQLGAFPLLLPPLNEQHRIIAKLEKLLSPRQSLPRRTRPSRSQRRTRVSFVGANYRRAKWISRGEPKESQMSLSAKNAMHLNSSIG